MELDTCTSACISLFVHAPIAWHGLAFAPLPYLPVSGSSESPSPTLSLSPPPPAAVLTALYATLPCPFAVCCYRCIYGYLGADITDWAIDDGLDCLVAPFSTAGDPATAEPVFLF